MKNRCVEIENGTNYDDEYICGARNQCPEGYFCGKQNANPNFGVTNFDNLMFSLLVVFQCITLEGWSDIMVDFQKSYSNLSFILFLPIVFIGAFFLVNLTLAVINSSFSVTHKAQVAKTAALKAKMKMMKKRPLTEEGINLDDGPPDQIGINQIWVAQRAAKKMIALLRVAQERKKAKAKTEGIFGTEPEVDEEAEAKEKEAAAQAAMMAMRPIINKKQDEEEEEDFEDLVLNLLDDQQEFYEVDQKATKKDPNKEVKKYAVNEMRVANKLNKKLFGKKKGEYPDEIETNDAGLLAVKLPEIAAKEFKGPMADFKKLDDMLDLTNLLD